MSAAPLGSWERIPTGALAERWGLPRLEVYDRIASTNERGRALALEGVPPFTTVLAEEQTAGRGRGGATWHSPPGTGLWMSVLLPSAPIGAIHLPLLVGLAVAEALEAAGAVNLRLEWPNDLTVADRKVGGILCEAARSGVVAGIGINVHTPPGGFPPELAGRAGALDDTIANSFTRMALVGAISKTLQVRLAQPRARLTPEELTALAVRDALRGRRVVTGQEGPGVARGIEPDGALLLERPDGTGVRVVAGSVRPA